MWGVSKERLGKKIFSTDIHYFDSSKIRPALLTCQALLYFGIILDVTAKALQNPGENKLDTGQWILNSVLLIGIPLLIFALWHFTEEDNYPLILYEKAIQLPPHYQYFDGKRNRNSHPADRMILFFNNISKIEVEYWKQGKKGKASFERQQFPELLKLKVVAPSQFSFYYPKNKNTYILSYTGNYYSNERFEAIVDALGRSIPLQKIDCEKPK